MALTVDPTSPVAHQEGSLLAELARIDRSSLDLQKSVMSLANNMNDRLDRQSDKMLEMTEMLIHLNKNICSLMGTEDPEENPLPVENLNLKVANPEQQADEQELQEIVMDLAGNPEILKKSENPWKHYREYLVGTKSSDLVFGGSVSSPKRQWKVTHDPEVENVSDEMIGLSAHKKISEEINATRSILREKISDKCYHKARKKVCKHSGVLEYKVADRLMGRKLRSEMILMKNRCEMKVTRCKLIQAFKSYCMFLGSPGFRYRKEYRRNFGVYGGDEFKQSFDPGGSICVSYCEDELIIIIGGIFVVGMASASSLLLIREVSSPRIREALVGTHGFLITVGHSFTVSSMNGMIYDGNFGDKSGDLTSKGGHKGGIYFVRWSSDSDASHLLWVSYIRKFSYEFEGSITHGELLAAFVERSDVKRQFHRARFKDSLIFPARKCSDFDAELTEEEQLSGCLEWIERVWEPGHLATLSIREWESVYGMVEARYLSSGIHASCETKHYFDPGGIQVECITILLDFENQLWKRFNRLAYRCALGFQVVTSLRGGLGLNNQETHTFSTAEEFSLDVCQADGLKKVNFGDVMSLLYYLAAQEIWWKTCYKIIGNRLTKTITNCIGFAITSGAKKGDVHCEDIKGESPGFKEMVQWQDNDKIITTPRFDHLCSLQVVPDATCSFTDEWFHSPRPPENVRLIILRSVVDSVRVGRLQSVFNLEAKVVPTGEYMLIVAPGLEEKKLARVHEDEPVIKAFYKSEKAHIEHTRASDDPNLNPCVETAIWVAHIGVNSIVAVAGLLHDTVDYSFLGYGSQKKEKVLAQRAFSKESKGIDNGLDLVFISERYQSLRPPEQQFGEVSSRSDCLSSYKLTGQKIGMFDSPRPPERSTSKLSSSFKSGELSARSRLLVEGTEASQSSF